LFAQSSSGGAAKGIAAKGMGKSSLKSRLQENLRVFSIFGLVESCEHINQMLDDLSRLSQGKPSLNNFSLHGMYIEQSQTIDEGILMTEQEDGCERIACWKRLRGNSTHRFRTSFNS